MSRPPALSVYPTRSIAVASGVEAFSVPHGVLNWRTGTDAIRLFAMKGEWAKLGGLRVLRAASTISETLVWANAAG